MQKGPRPAIGLWLRSCSRLSVCRVRTLAATFPAFPACQVFHESIIAVSNRLTRCTLQLYTDIVQDLPPTPSKFHYIFNLRDLSRVFQGLVLTNPERWVAAGLSAPLRQGPLPPSAAGPSASRPLPPPPGLEAEAQEAEDGGTVRPRPDRAAASRSQSPCLPLPVCSSRSCHRLVHS